MSLSLPTATLGNAQTLLSLGGAGELMAWFFPHKDAAQQIEKCYAGVYLGHGGRGSFQPFAGDDWQKTQAYLPASNALQTSFRGFGFQVTFTDLVTDDAPVLVRRIAVKNVSQEWRNGGFYLFGEWHLGGNREGNGAVFRHDKHILLQNHREAALCVGGDALQGWHIGKAGDGWGSNAEIALQNGVLNGEALEIGAVNWAVGFYAELEAGQSVEKTLILALGDTEKAALAHFENGVATPFEAHLATRLESDASSLQVGLETLETALKNSGAALPDDLKIGYERSLLCLPFLCGEEGAAVAAPEFDPRFESCGGYGYLWPRDGAEYVSGLQDAGYPDFALRFFDWCARHQDESGLWQQRYFLNGESAPNWCLPSETLQVDQVGAVLWAFGKWFKSQIPAEVSGAETSLDELRVLLKSATPRQIEVASGQIEVAGEQVGVAGEQTGVADEQVGVAGEQTEAAGEQLDVVGEQTEAVSGQVGVASEQTEAVSGQIDVAGKQIGAATRAILRGQILRPTHREMIRRAADYIVSRQDENTGVHRNAFDTWETFIGSFTYSNAALHAALRVAFETLGDAKYARAAAGMKAGVLTHFVRHLADGTPYLTRGFGSDGSPDETVDSASLGAIEPFGLLDLNVPAELELALGTLRAVTEKLEVEWMGARAIRRFEGDAYVGGVPACVNTLWMARCCLHVAAKNGDQNLIERAQSYLQVVLRRATPTGLLPELMQGPDGQSYWAAPHGWAMSSFVSGVLKLAALKSAG